MNNTIRTMVNEINKIESAQTRVNELIKLADSLEGIVAETLEVKRDPSVLRKTVNVNRRELGVVINDAMFKASRFAHRAVFDRVARHVADDATTLNDVVDGVRAVEGLFEWLTTIDGQPVLKDNGKCN